MSIQTPSGNLVTPVAFDPSENISALKTDSNGNLLTNQSPFNPDGTSDATQVTKDNTATNATAIIHTVTTGKNLFLTSLMLSVDNGSAAVQKSILRIRNASDVKVVDWSINLINGQSGMIALSFPIPLLVSAGFDIVVISPALLVVCDGTITGYEI